MSIPTSDTKQSPEGVIVRHCHQNDLAHIRRIFIEATMTGRGSPYQKGMAIYNSARAIYPSIGSIAFLHMLASPTVLSRGLLPSWLSPKVLHWAQVAIGSACALVSLYLWYKRRQVKRLFRLFLEDGLAGEVGDIIKSYHLHVTENGFCVPSGPSGFWVAEIEEEIVGGVGLNKSLRIDPVVGDVRRLFVAPGHQGKGIAAKLMATLVSHARDHNLCALELTTSDYNQTALRFYERIGWKLTRRTSYHGFMIAVLRQEVQ
ncbi:hypothetical protein H0H87_008088 [Tephrocybe sp. NHM501043]|nr:hypothetical protein H0H87_008088 [Tephrocybe sp. NHM501043]